VSAELLGPALLILLSSGVFIAHGHLTVVPEATPQCVFAGGQRKITVKLRNDNERIVETEVLLRLHQTSSTTTARIGDFPWKKIQVLSGQTILESAQLDFPEAKAETHYLVQWLESTNRVLGATEVLVYPQDLLVGLKPLVRDEALGVFDPHNQLKPLLNRVAVEFTDLEDAGVENFRGRLAIFGPFKSKAQMRERLAEQVEALAAKGVAVVWIQPPPEPHDKLQPSFYTVTVGKGAVVIVQSELVANLPERPQSQLNLIHCARLAMYPEPVRLPHLTPQP